MSIKINFNNNIQSQVDDLNHCMIRLDSAEVDPDLDRQDLKQIYQILNNNELKVMFKKAYKNDFMDKLSYSEFSDMYYVFEKFFENIKQLKEKIDIDVFFEEGNIIDIQALKKKYVQLGRNKIFKKFNFKRLKQLFENPPTKLLPQDGSGSQYILYDKYVVRKYLYAVVQMVINEMDLLVGYVGSEGMGKSCGCSQDMNLIYYILKELDLIDYKYDIKEMWFGNLDDFLDAEDRYFDQKFRILGLDEGNELNRQDWQDERVKTFFQRLRRERYNQRIKFICLPQLGELMTAIVLSRMNFIFSMYSTDDIKTGTLNKGYCNMYIIPRTDKIYSPYQKREITKSEVIDTLGVNLEDKKKHLKSIPSKLLISKFTKNYIWGFNKKEYDETIKAKNKTFTVAKGVKISPLQSFLYYKYRPALKNWGIDRKTDKNAYDYLAKMDRLLCKKFEDDPTLYERYEKMIENKKKRKGENA